MPPRNPTPDIMADLLRNQPAPAIVQIPLDDIADQPPAPKPNLRLRRTTQSKSRRSPFQFKKKNT